MSRLIVNPGSPDAWEVELKPGSNALGRGETNDITLDHDSISTAHCDILVAGAGATLNDLGSTNGTFVGGQLVEQAQLSDGQLFQAGSIEIQFVADTPAPASTKPVVRMVSPQNPPIPRPPPLPSAPPSAATFCKSHPRTMARFHCPQCQVSFCELCVNTRQTGNTSTKFCRTCGAACAPLVVRPAAKAAAQPSYPGRVGDAFFYPFNRDGLVLLVTGTIFLCIINAALYLCRFAFCIGGLAMIFLSIYGIGYFTSFYRRIITATAAGEEAMPDWPDVTDFSGDILAPFGQFIGTIIASFLPAIVVSWFMLKLGPGAVAVLVVTLIGGATYFPMAFLAVSMFDSVVATNPLTVIPAIAKIPFQYLLTTVIFMVALVVKWSGDMYLPRFLPVPLLPSILSSFIGLYLLTVLMRILGVLYRDNKAKFGWFTR